MPGLTVFTPSYNRANVLPRLYESLLAQTNQDFCFFIIDDGSDDGTKELVEGWIKENKIDIRYHFQENGGKSRAYNKALDLVDTELISCVDSDDWLSETAVSDVFDCWAKATDDTVGIVARRDFGSGTTTKVNLKPSSNGYPCFTLRDGYDKYGLGGDTMLVHKSEVIKKYRFPEIEGEKFVTESYLYDQIDQDGTYMYLDKVLYLGEYRSDGYTTNYKRLLYDNGWGFIAYIENRLRFDKGIKRRFGDSIRYMDMAIAKGKKHPIRDSVYPIYSALAYLPGLLLYRMRYMSYREKRPESGKKKILIFSHALELGGAETALLGLLENIDTSVYDVDLFLMRHKGELMEHVPEGIHLLPELSTYSSLAVSAKEVLKKKQYAILFARFMGREAAKRRVKQLNLSGSNEVDLEYSHKFTAKYMENLSDIFGRRYDLAISFLTPHYFVLEKVKAKKKLAWIHTDYSFVDVDVESQTAMWAGYDYIASISDAVTDAFLSKFPSLSDKIVRINNILPVSYMKSRANEFDAKDEMPADGSVRLLSIGRYSHPKNFDNVPNITMRMRELGMNVKWYIIGYGADEELIKSKIKEANAGEYVILLGKKANPYPYIKACDVYVQPSRYEGKSVAVREAQVFNKPVIITDYATSKSQLEDGFDGIIVPLENVMCAEAMVKVIEDKELLLKLSENTRTRDYSDEGEVEKVCGLV